MRATNAKKVLFGHMPFLVIALLHFTLFGNALLFVAFHAAALACSAGAMRFPPFWGKDGPAVSKEPALGGRDEGSDIRIGEKARMVAFDTFAPRRGYICGTGNLSAGDLREHVARVGFHAHSGIEAPQHGVTHRARPTLSSWDCHRILARFNTESESGRNRRCQ